MGAVFITGGSGFIGGRLIERLRGEGHDVRALARSEAAAESVRARGAEPVRGDLAGRGRDARGSGRLRARIPRRRHPRRLGQA